MSSYKISINLFRRWSMSKVLTFMVGAMKMFFGCSERTLSEKCLWN